MIPVLLYPSYHVISHHLWTSASGDDFLVDIWKQYFSTCLLWTFASDHDYLQELISICMIKVLWWSRLWLQVEEDISRGGCLVISLIFNRRTVTVKVPAKWSCEGVSFVSGMAMVVVGCSDCCLLVVLGPSLFLPPLGWSLLVLVVLVVHAGVPMCAGHFFCK